MDLGMPTLIELKSIEACAALCRELGLAFVELGMDLPEYQYSGRLRHMHIHDAVAEEKRAHMTLGEVALDLPGYLDMAKEHDCRAVLEVKTIDGLRRSVEWLKAKGLFRPFHTQ